MNTNVSFRSFMWLCERKCVGHKFVSSFIGFGAVMRPDAVVDFGAM